MIGKCIYGLLSGNTELTALVPLTSIFPYIINENTPLPAITYMITSVTPNYNKDGWNGDQTVFAVTTYCADYAVLQDIAAEVRDALELKSGVSNNTRYNKIYLDGQEEGFNITENVFMNRLTFRVLVNGYNVT